MGACASCERTCVAECRAQPAELVQASPATNEPAEVAGNKPAELASASKGARDEEPLPAQPAETYAEFVDTSALRELLTCGDLVLVKASYLIELAASWTCLPRRQDLPEHGVCDAEMVERALGELEALLKVPDNLRLQRPHFQGVVVLSYAWASARHPDPECQLLRDVVAPALEWYLSERAGYLQRGGIDGSKGWSIGRSLNTLADIDCCVFVDYPSMHQKPRDAAQDDQFYRALNRMELLYGHQLTVKLRATRSLSSASGSKPYEDRGWPFFETCVAGLVSGAFSVLDLGSVDWTQPVRYPVRRRNPLTNAAEETGEYPEVMFSGTLKPLGELAKQATYNNVVAAGLVRPLMLGRAVPQVPERFAVGLKTKTFTNQADVHAVMKLHQRVCQRVLGSVKDLSFGWLGWSEEQVPAIGELCSSCPWLERVRFPDNSFGPKGVAALAEVLADRENLVLLGLFGCCAGDEGVKAFCDLAAANKFKRLKEVVFSSNNVGDAGFAALTSLLKLRPEIRCLGWENNPEGDGKRAYREALECFAVEEGYVPQPACPDAPRVVLAPLGGEEGRFEPLQFEHAAGLKRGEPVPLTLSSHPGRAIVPLWESPRLAAEWSYIHLGVGPADKAVVAQLRGEFLTRISDGRVLDIAHWRYVSGAQLLLLRHIFEHPEKTHYPMNAAREAGGRSFAVNERGNIASLKEPSLVLGVAEVAPPPA